MQKNAYESHRDMMQQSVAWRTQHGMCLGHFHSSVELLYMVSGSMTVILDGAEVQVHAGECLFCSSYMIHSYQEEGEHESIVAIIPLTSIAALPVIYPAALLTTDCPMSNTAITMLNVLLTKYTATHIFTKYLKNIQVSTSCRLFRSVIILISS